MFKSHAKTDCVTTRMECYKGSVKINIDSNLKIDHYFFTLKVILRLIFDNYVVGQVGRSSNK